jgi:membrane protein implicated in regulation of membrane protease activity
MLESLTAHYGWWLFALVLIGAELVMPGYFMLWIGIAAAAVGVVLLAFPELSFFGQTIAFVVLAIASCWCYWRFLRPAADAPSDQPLLNRRAAQFIGRRYALESAIVNGRGKVKVGDSPWLAEGPDLPAGAEVEVVSVEGTTLIVRAAP